MQAVIKQLTTKKIAVLGLGLTGLSCVRFLQRSGVESCLVIDSRDKVINPADFSAEFPTFELILGEWGLERLSDMDMVIVSPGIDTDKIGLTQAISPECEVLGDVELFCRMNSTPIIAVTGSNGKSTVVSCLAKVAESIGVKAELAGNVGTPVLDLLESDAEFFIFELSSFQLETISSLKAVAATVLNVSDDHLDRHLTIENYQALKQKIYFNAQHCIVNRDDERTFVPEGYNQDIVSFGCSAPRFNEYGITEKDGHSWLAFGDTLLVDMQSLPLAGKHNAANYLAVIALTQASGWPLDKVIGALATFSGLAHRCQRVPSQDSIQWINDSKATNVGATLAAISGLAGSNTDNQLIVIAGGDGKGADFAPLKDAIEQHVDWLVTLGKDGAAIAALTKNSEQVSSIEHAVQAANKRAKAGDTVLLSPACASIDMFKNYMQRGDEFARAVADMQEAS